MKKFSFLHHSFIAMALLLLAACGDAPRGPAFSYDGKELELKLEGGKYLTFTDGPCDQGFDGCVIHQFRGTFARDQFYFVHHQYYEGGKYMLYSYKSGNRTIIYGEPHLSPQENLIATAMGDEMNDDGTGIRLFEIANGEAKELFHYKPNGYALYRFDKWINNNEAAIELYTMCRDNGRNDSLTMPVHLRNTPTGWQLDQGIGEACIQSTRQPKPSVSP
jgi:hypothetical protein